MRRKKTIQLEDRKVTVYELRVRDIRQILSMDEKVEEMDIDTVVSTVLPMVCDLGPGEFDRMGLSSLMSLWDAAREVNAAFFDLARRAGLGEIVEQVLDEMKISIAQSLTDASAALSAGDTPTPQSTDGGSS